MIRSFLLATLMYASFLPAPANAATRGLARSVSNIDTVRLVQDHLLWSTDKTLDVNSVSVGDTINGLKINYIGCIFQDKTYPGWRGGPKYTAIKGTYNCYAGSSKGTIGPGSKGPQLILTVVRTVR